MKTRIHEGLDGQVALVSGASGGMGSAICQRLVRSGMHVVMLGRSAERLEQARLAMDVGPAGQARLSVQVIDIADPDAVRASVDELSKRFARIDLLVHAAGDGPLASLLETSEALWQKSIQGKLMGTVRLTRAVAAEMCRYQAGQIVIVNGVFSREPDPLFIINSTVNCALAGFAKSVARDLGHQGVRTNVVNPGATQTPLWDDISESLGSRFGQSAQAITDQVTQKIPLGRLASPGDVAEVVALLASPASSYLNGATIDVDGGATAAI